MVSPHWTLASGFNARLHVSTVFGAADSLVQPKTLIIDHSLAQGTVAAGMTHSGTPVTRLWLARHCRRTLSTTHYQVAALARSALESAVSDEP